MVAVENLAQTLLERLKEEEVVRVDLALPLHEIYHKISFNDPNVPTTE